MNPQRVALVATVLKESRSRSGKWALLKPERQTTSLYIGRGQMLLQSRRVHAEANAALLSDSGNRDGYYD